MGKRGCVREPRLEPVRPNRRGGARAAQASTTGNGKNVRAAFDRLDPASPAPLAVAFSGGGDSLALLLMAKAWADRVGRRLVALTVDHGLQPASADWARWCAARSADLGVEQITLAWTGRKPLTGVADTARTARHGLIAEAARGAGAVCVLMGHTADDLMENAAMRAAGTFVADPAPWAPSPAWPEGRGVFLLRPLLGWRRAALRVWLAAAGETWIEDPANDDLRHPRARARILLTSPSGEVETRPPGRARVKGLAASKDEAPRPETSFRSPLDLSRGRGEFPRAGLSRTVVGAAMTCAGGRATPPRGAALDRLMDRLEGIEPFTATLAGARIEAGPERVVFLREAGDMKRAGVRAPLALPVDVATVWDGRFEITARRAGLAVVALSGHAGRLDREARAALEAVPARARPTLPALIDPAGRIALPSLRHDPRVEAHDLTGPRLAAALGAVGDEATAWRMAKRAPGP